MPDDQAPSSPEPKIEDVLEEIKKGGAAKSTELSPDRPAESEIQNLKKVLEQADAQADLSTEKPQPATTPQEPVFADFNENFLKLEQIIKDLKKQS